MPRKCQGRNAARRLVWSIGGWVKVPSGLVCFGKDNLIPLQYYCCYMRLFESIIWCNV
jgi:hypothetical protein